MIFTLAKTIRVTQPYPKLKFITLASFYIYCESDGKDEDNLFIIVISTYCYRCRS